MKAPRMLYGERLSEHQLGKYTGILWYRVESGDLVKYEYVMAVHDSETDLVCMFVTSEINEEADQDSGDTHYLGVFHGEEYERTEPSGDWGDEEKFRNKALQVVMDKLGIDVMELLAPGEVNPPVNE